MQRTHYITLKIEIVAMALGSLPLRALTYMILFEFKHIMCKEGEHGYRIAASGEDPRFLSRVSGVPSLAMHRPVLHNKVPLSRGVWGLGI